MTHLLAIQIMIILKSNNAYLVQNLFIYLKSESTKKSYSIIQPCKPKANQKKSQSDKDSCSPVSPNKSSATKILSWACRT